MARRRGKAEVNIMSNTAFLDAMANTIGALIFLLMMVAAVTTALKLNLFELEILNQSLPDAVVGQEYDVVLAGVGGNEPYQWRKIEGELPEGLKLEIKPGPQTEVEGKVIQGTTARVHGIPVRETTHPVSFVVGLKDTPAVDESSGAVKAPASEAKPRTLSIAVLPAGRQVPPLKVLTAGIPAACIDRDYMLYPAALGGRPPYRWSVDGAPPPGVSLDGAAGRFAGKASQTGQAAFSLIVTDSTGATARSAGLSLDVFRCEAGPAPTPPDVEILSATLPDAVVGKAYELSLSAKGGDGRYSWSGTGLPQQLTVSVDGRLRWVPSPSAVGHDFSFSVGVQSGGRGANRQLKLSVVPGPSNLKMF